ncbi:hypothetical protein QUF58_13430 [Anaerolineales bacterium HSG24]|nr:hypothetical protein [Anaerolineales bacterium HSG24]
MESFVVNTMQAADVKFLGISLLSPGFRFFLGLGIVFCQVVIIMAVALDRVGDTVRDVIKPIVRLFPLAAFLSVSYNTFSPIIFSVMPNSMAQAAGEPQVSLAQAVNSPAFSEGILLTLATMMLFLIASSVLRNKQESNRVRELEAHIRRLKRNM